MTEKKKSFSLGRLTWKKVLLFLLIVVIIMLIRTGVFTVGESEQAVMQTFGKYTGTYGAGLHVKLPWPIQTVTILPVQRTQKLELGYYQDPDGRYHSEEDDSLMITGDMNLVNIDFFVEWKISDPYKYLFRSENPKLVLQNMLMSSVRSVVGMKSIDDTLTTGKYQIQNEVQEILMEKLEENDIGIQIIDVKVNDSEPPTEEVAKAFRDVETAKQEKDTALNEAAEYRNRRLPEAKAKADKLVKDAEALKQRRINEATGQRDRYLAVYSEYKSFPGITRQRMYLEVLQDVLPGVRVIVDGSGEVQKFLPLSETTNQDLAAAEEAAGQNGKGGN